MRKQSKNDDTGSVFKLTSNVQGGPVAEMYGSDDAMLALAGRINAVHPKAELMGVEGCLYMAQISLATGARALPAEAHEIQVWPGDAPGELIFDLGFDFHNRIAWESGGYILIPTPKEMTDGERQTNGVGPGDLAFRCGLIRLTDLERLKAFGVTFADVAKDMVWEGIAVVTTEEMKSRPAPTGRTWAWRCKRRAIKDAIRLAFGTSAKVLYANVEVAPEPTNTGGNGRSKQDLEKLNEDLFG